MIDHCVDGISTHTPLAGRDKLDDIALIAANNFYSHAPCGARRSQQIASRKVLEFLLTRPLRGATVRGQPTKKGSEISTHTPLAGRDVPADVES